MPILNNMLYNLNLTQAIIQAESGRKGGNCIKPKRGIFERLEKVGWT